MLGEIFAASPNLNVHEKGEYLLRMRHAEILLQLEEFVSLHLAGAGNSGSATSLDVLPGHTETEKISSDLCPALCRTHLFVHEMAKRNFHVIHEHSAPAYGSSGTFQPGHIVVNEVSLDVAIIMVVRHTHGDATAVLKRIHLHPTVVAHRYLAMLAESSYKRRLLKVLTMRLRVFALHVFGTSK